MVHSVLALLCAFALSTLVYPIPVFHSSCQYRFPIGPAPVHRLGSMTSYPCHVRPQSQLHYSSKFPHRPLLCTPDACPCPVRTPNACPCPECVSDACPSPVCIPDACPCPDVPVPVPVPSCPCPKVGPCPAHNQNLSPFVLCPYPCPGPAPIFHHIHEMFEAYIPTIQRFIVWWAESWFGILRRLARFQRHDLLCLLGIKFIDLNLYLHCPLRNHRIIARVASLRMFRGVMSRHDFLARLSNILARPKFFSSQLRKLLSATNDHQIRLGILSSFRYDLPNKFSLCWLFLAVDLSSFLSTGCTLRHHTRGSSLLCHYGHQNSNAAVQGNLYEDPINHKAKREPCLGGGQPLLIPFATLEPYMLPGFTAGYDQSFRFMDHILSTSIHDAYPAGVQYMHTRVPLKTIGPLVPLKYLFKIAKIHNIKVGSHVPKDEILKLFDPHVCDSCKLYTTVFAAVESKTERVRKRKHISAGKFQERKEAGQPIGCAANNESSHNIGFSGMQTGYVQGDHTETGHGHGKVFHVTQAIQDSTADVMNDAYDFPPSPADPSLEYNIVQGFCEDSVPQNLEEAGCAVCGQLTVVSQLSRLKAVKNQLHILVASSVTRVERQKSSDPIREFRGPVLDYKCNRICDGCRKMIRKNQIPRHALAKGLWIGEVPEELSSLRFVEKLLIARVRVNSCFVRVASSGLRKMVSNAIAFESPVPKVYNILPPPVEDLDDVLAVLFTGPCKPTEKEYRRTPLLIRRKNVARALEWLKLNHADYADLEISYEELSRYPEDSPPVSVEYRLSESNKVEEGTSVFDNAVDDGVSDGDCPFLVHGITGDQVPTQTVETLKAIALKHWNNKGGALSVSHSATAQSIYNNPNLYPQMFPWLFPYGLGGIGTTDISDKLHKRVLLMYHDKRFQLDLFFPFVAFSHEQVKLSTSAGFLLAETSKFSQIANRLLNINQDTLANISERMARGEVVKPASEEEAACFQLINDLDHINGKVDGSTTSKKYMRSEIWSLIAYMGAPLWYITLSPADNKHPLCLYFADGKERFDINLLRTVDERYRLIANNPVAGARFFDFMMQMFIKHVLGIDTDHRGLYGDTSAYYGTVEQQGRLSLHMHMLLWIKGGVSPDEIRRRMRDPNSVFRKSLVQYLESVHAGEFMTGRKEEVERNIDAASTCADYHDPTETMPEPPPPACRISDCSNCEHCGALASWWARFKMTVDDLLLRSNVHKCTTNKNKDGSQNQARTFKGCLDNVWGKCRARFPRPTFDKTEVDEETGAINMKKHESWLNSFSYVVTYLFRCNTDITSLRSGTAIKGVLLYVSDYVTKLPLKTHVVFDTIRSVFQKNPEMVGGCDARNDNARKLMTKIVNTLSAKMEMGSPMICMYLLGLPDHYTSHKFRPFFWQSFVRECRKPWVREEGTAGACHSDQSEKVALLKHKGRVIGLSPVFDYVFHPEEIDSMCLYDWFSRCEREKKRVDKRKLPDHHGPDSEPGEDNVTDHDDASQYSRKSSLLSFQVGHPLAVTHGVRCRSPSKIKIPNFIGATLPRFDQGDREYYCCTMLTLFKPWRSGLDLKGREESWDDAFSAHSFSPRQLEIMKNMNIRYECMDARDDFHAQMKKGAAQIPDTGGVDERFLPSIEDVTFDEITNAPGELLTIDNEAISAAAGKREKARCVLMNDTRRILSDIGWSETKPSSLSEEISSRLSPLPATIVQAPSAWKAAVAAKRAEILNNRSRYLPADAQLGFRPVNFIPDDVRVVDKSYLSSSFRSKEWQKTIDTVSRSFQLNKEQNRAFRIVANHICNNDSEQLRMYIGGMAGTGKSQVFKALLEFFSLKNESHRLIVVAPTGSAAALLGGSTYHSAFGINTECSQTSNVQLSQIKSRLVGVEYVFLDEVSMLSCRDMYLISERLSRLMNNLDTPFGGMNMIFAGDFAQLPPVIGQEHASLYSRTIGRKATSVRDQEAAIGKALWHQVTTVVILRENMRQRTQTKEDAKFREALTNMRYKACSPDDIAFLRSRVSSGLPSRSCVNEPQFRNVSIITALNSVKDEVNRIGCLRFAAETGQELTHFYSVDTVPSEEPSGNARRNPSGKRRAVKHNKIPDNIQRVLWEQPCCTNTKLIPAKLSLCIGMPLMIRNNAATELGITKGQEAFVRSWESSRNLKGKQVLETLFVKLIDPPATVRVEGLPDNVIPLTKTSVLTTCQLPDDTMVTVSRNQIEAIPNFAMTDYSSQGKTRPYNVVDLSYSRSHQGYYTALSRSATASGTLILSSFHPSKITGGASGALRQEFREVELLDDITMLMFMGKLPRRIAMANRRNHIIALFRQHKGANYIPSTMHKAIRWSKADPFLEYEGSEVEWTFINRKSYKREVDAKKHTGGELPDLKAVQTPTGKLVSSVSKPCSPPKKRKRSDTFVPGKKLKMIDFEPASTGSMQSLSTNVPFGTQWENNSCAYDAIFTLLFNVWREDPASIHASWQELQSDTLNKLLDRFRSHESIPAEHSETRYTLDQIREYMRHLLARLSDNFVFGQYTSVDSVLDRLLTSASSVVTRSVRFCPRGHDVDMRQAEASSCHIVLSRHGCSSNLQEYLDDITTPLNATCPVCAEILSRRFTFALHPPLITIELHGDRSTLEELEITSGSVRRKYHLQGLIYYAAEHFTARFIARSGMVWYHDGLLTGRSLVYEGMDLNGIPQENAIVCLYVRSE